MLEFWQNSKRIAIEAIYSNGKVGQLVIYGQRGDWGENPDPTQYPLSQYSTPSIFTIVDKKSELSESYILSDSKGNRIRVSEHDAHHHLYDAQEWLTWNDMREKDKFSRKQRKIEQLEGNLDLLKDILVKQGIRIVTEEQTKILGI